MKYRHRVLALLSFASIITYVDRVCISVAGTTIQADLGLTLRQWGWVLSSFVLAYGLFEIPTGCLGDKLGPRRILTRIVAWWSLFTGLTGLARSFRQLIVVRFLFGVGEAGAFPNFSVVIGRWFPPVERARAQGMVWTASRIGGAVAPIVIIPLQQAFGWRATFWGLGLAGALWTAIWFWWFRDNPREKSRMPPSERQEIPSSTRTGSHEPTPWRLIFSRPNLWWIMLMYHANAWCGFFYLTWLYTFLVNGRGYTPRDLIAFSGLPFVVGAAANFAGGFASDALVKRIGLKWGRRWLGFGGLAAAAIFLTVTIFTRDKVWTVVFLALAYGCSDFALPVAWAVCLDIGQKHVGVVTGAMNMAGQVGSVLTTILFGYIVEAFGTYNAPLVPIAIMSLVGALAWLRIDATRPLIVDTASQVA